MRRYKDQHTPWVPSPYSVCLLTDVDVFEFAIHGGMPLTRSGSIRNTKELRIVALGAAITANSIIAAHIQFGPQLDFLPPITPNARCTARPIHKPKPPQE